MDTLACNHNKEGCDQKASQASVRWGQHHFSVIFAHSLKMWPQADLPERKIEDRIVDPTQSPPPSPSDCLLLQKIAEYN